MTVPPNIVDEESTPSSVAVRENQNISLLCKAEGLPLPTVVWKREDSQLLLVDRKNEGRFRSHYKLLCVSLNCVVLNYNGKHLAILCANFEEAL